MKSRTWFLSVSMLVFGTATLSMPAQTRLYILYSPRLPQAWWDYLGTSVSIAGDVNKDGFADIIMGAPTDSRGPGRAIVRSGKDGGLLYVLSGDSGNDQFGFSVSGAGDMDKDGFADFIRTPGLGRPPPARTRRSTGRRSFRVATGALS